MPFVWVLWDGRLDPLRIHQSRFFSNFYDLQARALFDGHWWVPKGSLGIEAFVIDGREYEYFGPFPAFLRMPLLAVSHRFDGRLTALSMLLAWVVLAGFSTALLWRVRALVRGDEVLGTKEAVTCALLLGSAMGGSVLLVLATQPAVYYEALIWGSAWGVGALFALIGVVDRPTVWRVLAFGACTLCAVLSRATVGWACVIGGVIAAAWLAAHRPTTRHLSGLLFGAALVPLVAGCAVTWMRFGAPFSQPLGTQVFSQQDPHRKLFLAANGGRVFGPGFAPTTLLAYLRPDGIHIGAAYPFITLPPGPPRVLGGAVFDQTHRTASVPATMPLLFALGCWGIVSVLRRGQAAATASLRIPLLAATVAGGGVILWSGIAPRFLADFLPLLVLSASVGLMALTETLVWRPRRSRSAVVGVIACLALFGLLANLGIATQMARFAAEPGLRSFVALQARIGRHTGHPVRPTIDEEAPPSAPAGTLLATPSCGALYLATGEIVPPRWLAVERGPSAQQHLDITYRSFDQPPAALVSAGGVDLFVEDRAIDYYHYLRLRLEGAGATRVSEWKALQVGVERRVDVISDVALHRMTVAIDAEQVFDVELPTLEETVVWPARQGERPPGRQITIKPAPVDEPTLCRQLTR
ncbi:MAG: hypothetical protein ACJ739_08475 [Acidimicrobiales bacterium]